MENSFTSKIFFIFGHWAIFLTNSRKKSSGVVKTGFSISMATFRWKFLQNLQIVIFLNIERKNFGWLSEKSQRGLQAAFSFSLGTTWRKYFRKSFSHLLWTFFGSFPVIEQEKFIRSLKTAFSVSIKAFWEKETVLENKWNFSSFSDLEQKVFGFLSSFSTGMLELHSTCPKYHFNGEQFFFQFFFIFGHWAIFFDQFSQKK